MSFWEMILQQNNITFTENGDRALKSSMSGCVDFMFFGGMGKNENITSEFEIIERFKKALNENPLYAIRLLFYNRDIRGGQGARRVFRVCLKYLADVDIELTKNILCYIPEYGRWDDLLCVLNTKSEAAAMFLIKETLKEDFKNMKSGKSISLLAKWLPSENASSIETKQLAKIVRNKLGMSSRDYRKVLSGLRSYLNIVEHHITTKNYSNIEYSHVPAKAMMKYRNVFMTKDADRYDTFIKNVNNNNTKLNANTLYPFDIIKKVMSNYSADLDAAWNALPDFFNKKYNNALVVADVSGSMIGNPLNACIGLAMYIAEHNKGIYHNKFITFSAQPTLQEIIGNTLKDKVNNLITSKWGMNTNISSVFYLIYNTAIENNVSPDEFPEMIYIVSDMQFDQCCKDTNKSTYTYWKEKFNKKGYNLPIIVFWNVADHCKTVPVLFNETNTMLVSGYSPAICKIIMSNEMTKSPADLVKNVCENDRYKVILSEVC